MGRKFTIFVLFYFVFEGKFQVQTPRGVGGGGGLSWEGRFNGGFFAVRFFFWGGGGGLYLEELIHGGAYFLNFTAFSLGI